MIYERQFDFRGNNLTIITKYSFLDTLSKITEIIKQTCDSEKNSVV